MNTLAVDAVILNPNAKAGKCASSFQKLLSHEFIQKIGVPNVPRFDGTQSGGLAGLDAWIMRLVRQGARNFVAAGGDGTVHAALNALWRVKSNLSLKSEALTLGAIGLGSSNDFHKPFRATGRSWISEIPCRLDFENADLHDLGQVHAPRENQRRVFAINASVGVTAEANWNFNEPGPLVKWLKSFSTDPAILITALRTMLTYKNISVRLHADDRPEKEITLSNLGLIKNAHFSGQMKYDLAPRHNDGLFGLHICHDLSFLQMLSVLKALHQGKFRGRAKTESSFCKKLEIKAPQWFSVETDGEVFQTLEAHFTCVEKGMSLCP